MRTSTMRELLAAQDVFSDLAPDDLALLATCSRNEQFRAGSLVAREGEPAECFYLVRHGRLAIELHSPGGTLRIDTAGPGELAGWSWLFPPYRWTADVRAVEPTRLVAIDGRCLRDKCEAEPVFGYRMMHRFNRVLTHRLEAMRLRLLDLYRGTRVS